MKIQSFFRADCYSAELGIISLVPELELKQQLTWKFVAEIVCSKSFVFFSVQFILIFLACAFLSFSMKNSSIPGSSYASGFEKQSNQQ
jgi:hypothetical protein